MVDIGSILFVDLLQISQYPGMPFTGNIIQDLIMFFFVPTVFLVLTIYIIVGRIVHHGHKGLRLLLGIAVYLFVIAGGYFSFFVLLSGPYFVYLIFIVGGLYYFMEHFTGGKKEGAFSLGKNDHYPVDDNWLKKTLAKPGALGMKERHRLQRDLRTIEARMAPIQRNLRSAGQSNNPDSQRAIAELQNQLNPLEEERQRILRALELDPFDRG